MAKKIFFTISSVIIFFIALSTISFAKSESNTTTILGDEVTKSANKTERSMDDLVDDSDVDRAGRSITNGVRDVGNTIRDGVEDLVGDDKEERTNDRKIDEKKDSDEDEKRNENRAVAGRTGDYRAEEVQLTETNQNGMSRNAWIWIVLIVVALIIVAAVWFYAAQKN